MKKKLDPLLHNELRLSVMSILISVEMAEFNYLLQETEASKGNLSVQLTKLKEAGYIEVNKSFKGNFPLTTCNITDKGKECFKQYVTAINQYLKL